MGNQNSKDPYFRYNQALAQYAAQYGEPMTAQQAAQYAAYFGVPYQPPNAHGQYPPGQPGQQYYAQQQQAANNRQYPAEYQMQGQQQ